MLRFILLISFAVAILGKPSINNKIVGGSDTEIEDVPWQAEVLFVGEFICGGAIVTDKYVITAGTCTKDMIVWTLSVYAGSNTRKADGIEIGVVEVHYNPYFQPWDHDSDISILELETYFEFGSKIFPIRLPVSGEEPGDGAIATVSGWGYTSFDGKPSVILQSVQVPIVNKETCRKIFEGRNPVTDNMICAGLLGEGGKDSCEFDTGGPLSVDGTLIGIVSWGVDCGHKDYPGVYTSVPKFMDWIKRILTK